MNELDGLVYVDDVGGGRVGGYVDRGASSYPEPNRWYRLVRLTDDEIAALQEEPTNPADETESLHAEIERLRSIICGPIEGVGREADALRAEALELLRDRIAAVPVKYDATAAQVHADRQRAIHADNLAQTANAQHGTVND